jgi:quinoprotein glucose dehydrogenase
MTVFQRPLRSRRYTSSSHLLLHSFAPSPPESRESFRTGRSTLGGADSSQYSSLDQINKSTVSRLEVAWRYASAIHGDYRFNPIVVDGTMFVLAKNNSIVALDAVTGQEKLGTRERRGMSAIAGSTTGESSDRSIDGCCISMPDR